MYIGIQLTPSLNLGQFAIKFILRVKALKQNK